MEDVALKRVELENQIGKYNLEINRLATVKSIHDNFYVCLDVKINNCTTNLTECFKLQNFKKDLVEDSPKYKFLTTVSTESYQSKLDVLKEELKQVVAEFNQLRLDVESFLHKV